MDKDKRKPKSRSPSNWPSWLGFEALSKHCEWAVGGSDLPLSQTEKGHFPDMDEDCKYDMVQDFCQSEDVNTSEEAETEDVTFEDVTFQQLCEWQKEMRVQEHPHQGARRHREIYEFEDGRGREVSQWCDGRHQGVYQWEENVRGQELSQWEEDGVRYQELTQVQGRVTVQQLSPWQEETNQEQSQGAEDMRGQEPSQDDTAQELPQREKEASEEKQSQRGDDVGYNIWDKPLPPVNAGDLQTCPQDGPSSRTTVATEVAGEAAPDLPSVSPAPLSPTDTELAPAAAASQTLVPKKRPSRVRRALRALGRLLLYCWVGQPED